MNENNHVNNIIIWYLFETDSCIYKIISHRLQLEYNHFFQAGRAKKKSKQIQVQRGEDEEVKSAPHSFVIQRGKVGRNVTALMNNMRRVMAPFTAESLKVKYDLESSSYLSFRPS